MVLVALVAQHRMEEWLMNSEWEIMWQEWAGTEVEVLLLYLTQGTEKYHEKPVIIVSSQAGFWTWDLSYTKQECYSLDHNIRLS
jgi:hypothetical protein